MYSEHYYGSDVGPLLMVVGVLCLFIMLFQLFLNYKLFEKHYGEKGWYGLIPLFNLYIISKKTLGERWYYYFIVLFAGCVPLVGGIIMLIGSVWFNFKLAESLSRSKLFALGLFLLPIVFYPMLVFSDKTKYIGPTTNMGF